MSFNCPLHIAKADRIIEQFNLKPGSRVLDAGCGEGEFLVRVAERYEIEGFGFDLNRDVIEKAQTKAKERVNLGSVVFAAQDAADFSGKNDSYDLILCIGAEFIFGGYVGVLQKLKVLLKPNGLLLIGTIFWKQEPTPEYLQLMDGENSYFDHVATVELATRQGFVPLYICRSNGDEWDDFESSVSQWKYLKVMNQSPAPDAIKRIEEIKQWQDGYLKWGVHTMGFGFYLLRNV